MRRFSVALLPLGVSLALAACGPDSDTTTSRSITSVQRSSAGGPPSANACNVGDIKKAAQDFFAAQQDPVFGLLNDLQSASDLTAATAIGWNIQRRVAEARLTAAQDGTADDGAKVVLGTFKCTSLASSVPTDFVNNLALILTQGIFEVRGTGGSLPAAAWLSVASTRTLGSPRWGVEPVTTWPTTGAFLVYGYPKLITGTFVTPATGINTNGPGTYNGFELGSIPANQSKAGLRIGICVAAVNGTQTVANRLIHAGAIQVNSSPTQLCTASLANSSTFESVTRRLASFLAPQLLFAQEGEGRVGGLPSDWSPNTTGQLAGSAIAIKWTSTPNSNVGVFKNYVANVTIAGQPVPGVVVTVAISGNQGEPANAILLPGSTTTATTDASGNATFSLAFGKAGGYNLSGIGSLDGVSTQTGVTQKVFQIKN